VKVGYIDSAVNLESKENMLVPDAQESQFRQENSALPSSQPPSKFSQSA